jgi:hypothetical protein
MRFRGTGRLALLVGITIMPVMSGIAVAEDKREPKLATVTDAQILKETAARSSRNYAWMGYNTPELNLQLPAVDNSAYADVTFAPAKLLDKAGQPVAYEVEQGLYSSQTHTTEVRFKAKDAKRDTPPVEFAHATGTVKVRYPVAARTVVVKGAAPAALGKAKASVTGSSVLVVSPNDWKMLEPPFDSGLDDALRAYDAAGKRLEEDSSKRQTESSPAGTRTTHVFKGTVAQARIDVVDEWAEFDVAYDLAPAAKLPADKAGQTAPNEGVSGPEIHPTAVRRVPKTP